MSECKCGQESQDPEPKPIEVCDKCKAVLKISKSEFLERVNHIYWRIDTGYYRRAKNGLEDLKKQVL